MTPQAKALALTSQEKDAELVRLWELEESLKPRGMESAPKDGTEFLALNFGLNNKTSINLAYWSNGWKDWDGKMHGVGYRTHSGGPSWHDFKAWLPLPKFQLEGEIK